MICMGLKGHPTRRNECKYLPPAYVVRREGNSFTLFVSSHLVGGGGAVQPGGQVSSGGGSGLSSGGGGGSGQSSQGGGQLVGAGGGQVRSVAGGGGGGQVSSWGGGGGSAKIGQHNEYSLHGGRYASCVHAGLTCYLIFL